MPTAVKLTKYAVYFYVAASPGIWFL